MTLVHGSCLCRGVQWQAAGPLELMSHCHCSMCRKTHGAAFATYVAAPLDGYRLTQGEALIATHESSPGHNRSFCSTCGSCLPGADPSTKRVYMPAGCLDDDPETRPLAHIFVASKAPWHEITDTLPRFDAYPPKWEAPSVARAIEHADEPGWARASCLCGAIAYEIRQGPALVRNCHCSRCRKARGAAYASNLFTDVKGFRWIRGEDNIRSFKVPEAQHFTHYFCKTCGSSMPRTGARQAFVPMGPLDDDPEARPQMHIFCDSKAPWFEITDDLPQHAGLPDPPP